MKRIALVLMLYGCASSTQLAQRPGSEPISEARAAELAPDLYARAQEAARLAEQASGSERDDLEAAAALLREATFVEADRVELERKRHASEAIEEREERARAELERKRLSTEALVRRSEAARVARAEASRVLALAASDEAPGRAQDRESERVQASAWLIGRAQLTLAAALALGLPAPGAQPARLAIERAQRATRTGERLQAARDALEAAERAVGAARAASPQPSPEERHALLEMAAERGLSAVLDARGVVLDLSGAVAARGGALTALGRKQVEHVAAIARAHPHGALRVEAAEKPPARSRVLLDALTRVIDPARVQLGASSLPDPARIFVVLLAYGDAGAERALVTPSPGTAAPGRTE